MLTCLWVFLCVCVLERDERERGGGKGEDSAC